MDKLDDENRPKIVVFEPHNDQKFHKMVKFEQFPKTPLNGK